MKRGTLLRLGLFGLIHVLLLTLLTTSWWVHRNNNLFGNSSWIVGKDQGKFVFYTYEWLFRPLQAGRVNLGEDQGFQELLYHEPEDQDTRLEALDCEVAMDNGAYLWFQFNKKDQGRLGIRLTRTPRYPSGFFEFAPSGEMVRHTPFPTNRVTKSSSWFNVRIERDGSEYSIFINDKLRGTHTYEGTGGHFGFRGSGRARTSVFIRNVGMTFSDPSNPDRTWTVKENFKPRIANRPVLTASVAAALLFILLRLLRVGGLASVLPASKRQTFISVEGVIFSAILLAVLLAFNHTTGLQIPLAVLVGDLAALLILGRLQDKQSDTGFTLGSILAPGLLLVLLAAAASMNQGDRLGKATRSMWSKMQNVDPKALVLIPGDKPSDPFSLQEPVTLMPGAPFFAADRAYRDQEIRATFTFRGPATVDLVFQQQSYFTRGDVNGEQLALQRRLLRLSTVPDTPQGLSLGVHKRPAPFVQVQGELRADASNDLVVRANEEGVEVILNGTATFLPGIDVLGHGETGIMTYEPSVTLERFEVRPLESLGNKKFGLAGPSLLLLLPSLLAMTLIIRCSAGSGWRDSLGCALFAACPMGLYYAGAVVLDPLAWDFLGAVRFVWLDACMVLSGAGLLLPLALFKGRIKSPPLYFNIVFLAVLAAALLLTWDLLPAKHPLKYKYGKSTAVAPGEIVNDNRTSTGPWYSNNRFIGASTYVWKQRFGPKQIQFKKEPGTLRIFTIGGSQAWGSGAASSFETYDALLERRLKDRGFPVDIYNAGVNGAGLSRAKIYFDEILLQFKPDIVIADVGLNDSAALRQYHDLASRNHSRDLLLNSLRGMLEACVRNNIDFILCLESMSHEGPLRADKELYDGYAAIAAEFDVPVIDSRPIINALEETAMVWWDPAHYAPYGHVALADILEPTLTRVVEERLQGTQAE